MALSRSATPWHENPTGKRWRRFWTPARLFELLGLMEQGLTDEQIGEHFGKSRSAIHLVRQRYHLPNRRSLFLSATTVAEMMGIPCAKTVVHWIELGFLQARKIRYNGPNGYMWSIRRSVLESFISDPRTRHMWRLDRIVDPGLRALAEQQPPERYLTPGEVADRLFVTHNAVNNWIWEGILPAVRYGNWMVPESALEGFVPPGQREKTGRVRRYTTDEEQVILAERAAGKSFREIAAQLDRSSGSVCSRWHRLQKLEAAA